MLQILQNTSIRRLLWQKICKVWQNGHFCIENCNM